MKNFDYSILPQTGLAVMTSTDIDGQSPMSIADFRDTKVLVYKNTGHFIGFSKIKGIRLCRGPVFMTNGIVCAHEDIEISEKIKDVFLTADNLDFAYI